MNRKLLMLAFTAILLIAAIPREEPGAFRQDTIEGTWLRRNSFPQIWVFRSGKMQIVQFADLEIDCQVDTACVPGRIKFGEFEGIYKVTDKSLTICVASKSNRPPPKNFNDTAECQTLEFKRLD